MDGGPGKVGETRGFGRDAGAGKGSGGECNGLGGYLDFFGGDD